MSISSLRVVFLAFLLALAPVWAQKETSTPSTHKQMESPSDAQATPDATSDQTPVAAEPAAPLSPPVDQEMASRPQVPTYEGAFVKMLLVLLVLLFVIFFVIWLMRRLTRHRIHLFNQTRHIKIIERRPLSQKTALYILEIGEKKILVAESQLEVKRLASFEEITTVNE